jgi:GDP-L-fucose synthase
VVERHNPLEVWGDGNDLKEFIYVQDFIDGMLLAMEKIEGFEPINIATGRPCTVKEVLGILLEADNYENAKVVFDTSKPTMIPKRLIDATRARSLLGFHPKVSLEEGLKKTVAWYRSTLKQSHMA